MPCYRVHRLRSHLRQSFRHAPHVSGAADVKPRDYLPGVTVEASSPYAAYFALRGAETPLEPGDLLETGDLLKTGVGELRIFKFVGFEEARWLLPEPKPEPAESATPCPAAVD